MFLCFEWWIDKLLWSNKNEDFVQSNCGKQIVFPIFLAATTKNVSLSWFFLNRLALGILCGRYRQTSKMLFDPRNDRSRWWFQPIWKIQMGLFPQIGVKIPKIFELPPPSFNVGRGWKRSVRRKIQPARCTCKFGELNRSWLLLWKDFSNRILKGWWWCP